MNSFQYARAKAAWQAYHEATREGTSPIRGFDRLEGKEKWAWLAAAQAAIETASKYASGWAQ